VSEPNEVPVDASRSDEIAELPLPDEALRDGIGEQDNKIPLWFNVCFLATIVFAIVYVPYYHLYLGWSAQGQYAAEVEAAQARATAATAGMPDRNPYKGNAAAIAEGQVTFTTICAACHRPDGSGLVGPSLVDPYWKYGSSDRERFESVSKGRPLGMPPWEAQLGTEKIWKVLAYVDTLPKSDQPGLGAPAPEADDADGPGN
jgi:cytochrome c oxidase cbb3-type subunit III